MADILPFPDATLFSSFDADNIVFCPVTYRVFAPKLQLQTTVDPRSQVAGAAA